MNSLAPVSNWQRYVPLVGDIQLKNRFAYLTTRGAVAAVNTVQMAIAESYINGLEVPDSVLEGLFDACMPILFKYFPALLAPYEWVLQESSQLAEGSQELMKLQYDLSQKMFSLMLGDEQLIYPKYSMALWEKGAANLREAQMQMMDDAIEKLEIEDGDRVLDVGCGWGSFANYVLSRFPNIKVTGLNLSGLQCDYMRQKMQSVDSYLSSGRFTLIEGDFNKVELNEKFDKVISIGLFCHISNLTNAFRKIASFMKPSGKFFLHIITAKTPNNISSAFTHKYIFPYGRFWHHRAVSEVDRDLKVVKNWYLNGSNYSRTFANWRQNFDNNQEIIKNLDFGIDYTKFRRLWRFYLTWFIRNFASCDGEYNGNGQYLMVRTGSFVRN